jgi:hypothetical protein
LKWIKIPDVNQEERIHCYPLSAIHFTASYFKQEDDTFEIWVDVYHNNDHLFMEKVQSVIPTDPWIHFLAALKQAGAEIFEPIKD